MKVRFKMKRPTWEVFKLVCATAVLTLAGLALVTSVTLSFIDNDKLLKIEQKQKVDEEHIDILHQYVEGFYNR